MQWFPGHMTRAKRKIEESLPKVDIVAEIIDARIPESSRNPLLDTMLQNKPRMIVLNKSDLANNQETAKWIKYYKEKGIYAISVDSKTGKNVNAFIPAIKESLKDKIASWQNKGMVGRSIKIMVVGIPNVGKSAFINVLCRGGGKSKATVQDRPGVTREQRWFTIGKGFELLDTPGVLWPKFEDKRAGELLSFTGAVNDDVVDIEYLAARLLGFISSNAPFALRERYKLTDEEIENNDGLALLILIGKKRGMLVSGGETDTLRASKVIIDEFRGGKMGAITLETVK